VPQPSDVFQPGSDYQVRVQAVDGTLTSDYFTLVTGSIPSLIVPQSFAGIYAYGNVLPVTWTTGGLPYPVTIVLDLGPNTVANTTGIISQYTWTVANTGTFNLTWPTQPLILMPVLYSDLIVTINALYNPIQLSSLSVYVTDVIRISFNSTWLYNNHTNRGVTEQIAWFANVCHYSLPALLC
jgi:hypothetical protein